MLEVTKQTAATTTTKMATETDMWYNELKRVILGNFVTDTSLHAVVISNCNGDGPVPFSKATLNYELSNQHYPVEAFFGEGVVKIALSMKGKNSFRGENTFENLIQTVFSDTIHLNCLKSLLDGESKSEANIQNILATHYFHPLVLGNHCVIGKGTSNICDCCKKTLNVGDTSLGHTSVWHGRADIVVKHSVVKVTQEPENKELDADNELERGEQTESDSCFCSTIDIIDDTWTLSQTLAMAIVNGFCERNKNSSFQFKFIPSFLATEQFIRIIWYNVDWDILLLSEKMPIWSDESRSKTNATLNIDTLLQVWLALNFDDYDMNVKQEILEKTICSNFKNCVGEVNYSLYQEVAKPLVHFSLSSGPKTVAAKQTDCSSFVFAKVKESYFEETMNILS